MLKITRLLDLNVEFERTKRIIVVNIFLFYLLIDYSYRSFIQNVWNHYVYVYDPTRVIISVVILIVFFYIYYKLTKTNIALFFNTLIFYFFIVPELILYKNHPEDTFMILFFNLLFAFLVFLIFIPDGTKSETDQPLKELEPKYALFITIFLVLPYFILYKFNFAVNFSSLHDFLHVPVDNRRKAFENLPSYLLYLYHWMHSVIIPIFMANAIYKKKYHHVIAYILILVYLFLILSQKKVFFVSFVVLFFSLLKSYRTQALYFAVFINIGIIIGAIFRNVYDYYFIESIIVRRIFLVPHYLNILYFDFFEGNKLHLSYSILSPFFDYPYSVLPPFVIGEYYFNDPLLSANNGFISQGYMDFGVIGVLVNIMIISLIFYLYKKFRINHLYAGIILIFFFNILSSFLFTILITHGALLLLILFYFIGYKEPTCKMLDN